MSIGLKANADNVSGALQTAGIDRVAVGTDGRVSFPTGIAEFLGSNQSLTPQGYQKLPGGLIIQWGSQTVASNSEATFSYPIPFPNAVFQAFGNKTYRQVSASDGNAAGMFSVSNSQYKVFADDGGGNVAWIAIGF